MKRTKTKADETKKPVTLPRWPEIRGGFTQGSIPCHCTLYGDWLVCIPDDLISGNPKCAREICNQIKHLIEGLWRNGSINTIVAVELNGKREQLSIKDVSGHILVGV